MTSRILMAFTVTITALTPLAAGQDLPPAVYKSANELMATLKNAQERQGMTTAPVSNEGHYRINIVKRTTPGPAGAHSTGPAKGTELHYIIDGAGTVVTGGTLVPRPGAAAKGPANNIIQGGETRHVTKGDVVVIPEGTPHWYKDVEGSITYLEVRFDVDLGK